MARIIITGGLLLATIGLAVFILSGVWGTVLGLIGLLAIAVGVLTDWYIHSRDKPLGWVCILCGIVSEVMFFVVGLGMQDIHYVLYWASLTACVLGMGLGIFVGPYLLMHAKLKHEREDKK